MTLLLFTLLAQAEIPNCLDIDSQYVRSAGVRTERVGMFRNAAWLALRSYQIFVSPADGAGCQLYPSCSSYAIRAARRKGLLRGMWMATARIGHRHSDPVHPICESNGRFFRYDPPEEPYRWPPR